MVFLVRVTLVVPVPLALVLAARCGHMAKADTWTRWPTARRPPADRRRPPPTAADRRRPPADRPATARRPLTARRPPGDRPEMPGDARMRSFD